LTLALLLHALTPAVEPADPAGLPGAPPSPLLVRVVDILRRALGDPDRSSALSSHWSLHPEGMATTINILVKENSGFPVVWVFDPYDAMNGVLFVVVRHTGQVAAILDDIAVRRRAAQARK
jgi:hypothetical protein